MIAREARKQHGLVPRAQAIASGLTRHGVAHRVSAGRWERVRPGIYRVAGSVITWEQRIAAATLAAGTGAVASHRAAARLWAFPGVEGTLEVTVPANRRVALSGVAVHRADRLEARDVRRVEGIRATSIARTVIDLASVLTPPALEVVLDDLLAERLVTAIPLRRRLEELGRTGRKGAGALARTLDARPSGRAFPGSRLEALLLRVLVAHGLPTPSCQYRVRLPNGRSAFVDMAYPEARLAIEADSYRHHSGLTAWTRDRVRNNSLIAMGWRVLPVTHTEVAARPEAVAEQIAKALASAAPA